MAKVDFLFVDKDNTSNFKENHIGDSIETTDSAFYKVAFLEGTNEIATHGSVYGSTADKIVITFPGEKMESDVEVNVGKQGEQTYIINVKNGDDYNFYEMIGADESDTCETYFEKLYTHDVLVETGDKTILLATYVEQTDDNVITLTCHAHHWEGREDGVFSDEVLDGICEIDFDNLEVNWAVTIWDDDEMHMTLPYKVAISTSSETNNDGDAIISFQLMDFAGENLTSADVLGYLQNGYRIQFGSFNSDGEWTSSHSEYDIWDFNGTNLALNWTNISRLKTSGTGAYYGGSSSVLIFNESGLCKYNNTTNTPIYGSVYYYKHIQDVETDSYLTGSIEKNTDNTKYVLKLNANTKSLSSATSDNDGLATAYDVKSYFSSLDGNDIMLGDVTPYDSEYTVLDSSYSITQTLAYLEREIINDEQTIAKAITYIDTNTKTQTIEAATSDNDGLATAYDVQQYVKDNSGSTDIKFTIKNTLTNCTLSNTDTEIEYGEEYENTVTVTGNYEVKSIAILMGGIDITDTAWDSATNTISIDKVTGNIYINGVVSNGYTITYTNATHITLSNSATSVSENDQYTTTFTVNEGYNFNNVVVTMNGTDITSTVVSDKTITIAKVTGDVVITFSVSQITFTITQGTVDGVTCNCDTLVGYGDGFEIVYTLQDNYTLDEDHIVITEDGVSRDFVFDPDSNSIVVENVKGNIIYNIDCAATYTVTNIFNNITTSNSADTVTDQETYVAVLSFDTDSFKGITLTVTMDGNDVTNSVYDVSTYTITIKNPTGNITINAEANNIIEKNLNDTIDLTSVDWKFYKLRDVSTGSFDSSMTSESYDDSSWDTISIPHDWSSYNSFDTSTTGNEYESGWLCGGDAVYRCTITIPESYGGNHIYIHFDGVYMETEVFVNKESVGTNKNGYIPFTFDITDYVNIGDTNIITVNVTNHIPSSRWYSGSGIFRDAWISANNVVPIGKQQVVVTTPNLATEAGGTVTTNVRIDLENILASDITLTEVRADIYQEWDNVKVGTQTIINQTLTKNTTRSFEVGVGVSNPTLWTTHDNSDTIRLYKAKGTVKYTYNGSIYEVHTDEYIFGYRYITWDADGFYLNGEKTFLKGMCNHHDNGPIGSQTNYSASERKLRILRDMGCNTLRCTHNPESREFLECAARLGFMVIEELFDGWRYAKNSNTYDYARYFSADSSYIEVVVNNTINRDINNPAVVMWSLGNEVDEGCSTSFNSRYVTDATTINNLVKALDTTRPTTTGNNKPANTYAMQIMALVDICGVNYGSDSEYSTLRAASSNGTSFSSKCIYGSETVSPFYTRGIYEVSSSKGYFNCFDYTNTEQSNSHTSWGDASCVSLKRHQETYTWLAGTMPWTGFDYIGEPTPVNSALVRSSFFGVIDLCGFPKDAYYMYQSQWTTKPMIHIVPEDWTIWTEGSSTTVWVYSNCDTVKLHLNGVEQTATATPTTGSHYAYEYTVTYAKGTLVATGYDADDEIVAQDIRYSAGQMVGGKLIADKTQVARDGSLIFVEGQTNDKYGTLVPRGASASTFTVTGGTVLATDNGYPECFEDLRNVTQTTFTGRCLVIVKPDGVSDSVVITGTSVANSSVSVTIEVPQGDTNIYATTTQTFVDPENPPIHSAVTAVELSATSVHVDNGGSTTVTVTKTPSTSTDQITILSVATGFTATVNNSTNVITITNTVDDAKGSVLIDCGGIQKSISVSAGDATESTCTMTLNGEEYSSTNKSIYVEEYLPVSFTATGSTVASVAVSYGTVTIDYDATNSVIYGKADGTATLAVTLADGSIFDFEITCSTWTDSNSYVITDTGIKSVSSNYYLPTISTYTTDTSLSGAINVIANDTTTTTLNAVIDIPTSATITGTTLAEFGTDSTGTRKAYIIHMSGNAGSDIEYTLSMTDTANGKHVINIRCGTSSAQYTYKIGTLSCTSVTLTPSVVNITSDENNNQKLTAVVVPADTTDDIEWSVANNYTTCVGGQLFAIKNGTDTVTCTVGSQSATATINISGITEDETIIAYNAEITGSSQYYAGGSSGISWSSDYTLFAELKITDMSVSTANIMSFGSNISSWDGTHYHIYYPCTTNNTSVGNFTDKTTSGICIAMGTSSVQTCGVTTEMKGGQEADTIYIAQNANGLWINGTDATAITTTSGSFATIQALTTVQIGSMEGSGRFTGIIKQLRVIKTSDLNSTYATNGLTATELEEMSNNGFDPADYLAIYEASAASLSASMLSMSNNVSATAMTMDDIQSMSVGDSVQVSIVNPQKNNGYVFGYTNQTAGYSDSSVSTTMGSGFADVDTMMSQVQQVMNDTENAQHFVFTMTKTGENTVTLHVADGYGPKTGDNNCLIWSTTLCDFVIDDLSTFALSSDASMCDGYNEDNCFRFANENGYYINAQGSPANATFNANTSEWSVWYIYKMNF